MVVNRCKQRASDIELDISRVVSIFGLMDSMTHRAHACKSTPSIHETGTKLTTEI